MRIGGYDYISLEFLQKDDRDTEQYKDPDGQIQVIIGQEQGLPDDGPFKGLVSHFSGIGGRMSLAHKCLLDGLLPLYKGRVIGVDLLQQGRTDDPRFGMDQPL